MLGYTGSVGGTDTAVKLSFTVSNALAGQAVDLTPPYTVNGTTGAIESSGLENVCLMSFIDDSQLISDCAWSVVFIGKDSGDYLLESEEKAVVTVWLVNYDGATYSLGVDDTDPWIDAAGNLLGIYSKFTIEMRPEQGAVLSMERTLPGRLDPVMDLT
jgi:archaellin